MKKTDEDGRASIAISAVTLAEVDRLDSEYASLLSTILDASTEYSIVATTLDGTFVFWNEGARQIYGYEPAEVLGQNIRMLYRTSDLSAGKVDEVFGVALREGRWDGMTLRVRKDGEVIPTRVVFTARHDRLGRPNGFLSISRKISDGLQVNPTLSDNEAYDLVLIESTIDGLLTTMRDVTDQRQLRELLENQNRELRRQNDRINQANRLKNEFLASMSHELRTPLNSIIGFSDFLLTAEDDSLSTNQRQYLTHILNSGNHLLSLINDILDLAKVEAGKLELSPIPIDIRGAVKDVCASLEPQLANRQLEFVSGVDARIAAVVIDPLRFKQILYNLLSNAIKFTKANGRIVVNVELDGDSAFLLNVRDTGIGIPAHEIGRIFREFEQLDSGPGRRFSGTGLGLPLTQKLASIMGGSISVKSEVGVGSTFTARLPLRSPQSLPNHNNGGGNR